MELNEIYESQFNNKIRFWTGALEVEATALSQLRNISNLPILGGHIAVMPDCHMGMGATVGSVIPLRGAVIPAAVGVDIGCFVGNTLVKTLDGFDYKIKDLAEANKPFYVFSFDIDKQKIVVAKATARKTRKNAELLKVTLDNNETILCTPDHKFLCRDSSYVEAKDLKVDQSLMPLYLEKNNNRRVVSVKSIKKTADVYCLQVPKYHNFALSCGVFVHNCGMVAIQLSLTASDLPDDLKEMRSQIERQIPVGFNYHSPSRNLISNRLLPQLLVNKATALFSKFDTLSVGSKLKKFNQSRMYLQLGTLGGGNHFLEVCLDENQNVWLMLHSGSRNVGKTIGEFATYQAKELAHKNHIPLEDKALAWFDEGTPEFDEYINAMHWCQDYAAISREIMLNLFILAVKNVIKKEFTIVDEAINIHHNYANKEIHNGESLWITRKGAVNADKGRLGILPGCFSGKTRILMANGSYKNIKDVVKGDIIIDGNGNSTKVTNIFSKGKRKTWKYQNNNFHSWTTATPDHLHFIGNFDNSNYQKLGRTCILNKQNKDGSSRYHWSALSNLPNRFTFLLPRAIDFSEMPSSFNVKEEGYTFKSSYSVGYVFGTFLGDGCQFYSSKKGGQTTWYFVLDEIHIADKLSKHLFKEFKIKTKLYFTRKVILVVVHNARLARFFAQFGKKNKKALPDKFLVKDKKYLKGVYDGLIDSEGHLNGKTLKLTNTSKQLMEQFGVIHYMLFGYFPSVSRRKPSLGGLTGILENCNTTYRATSLRLPPLTKEYQCIEALRFNKKEKFIEVYDIEVESEDHSFIANNVIVHNSMGAKSFIVRGKGNEASYCSCAHGAGRKYSRTEAKRRFTLEDLATQTEGVECRKDEGVLDEIPSCYKDIDAVMLAQESLVEVVHTLKQILCVKG